MSQDGEKRRPNLIVIMVDDMGYSDLGCYGAEVIETPELDKIASQGLKFQNFTNTAKCHSSRVCLLSGLWCNQAGSKSLEHSATFGQILKDSGYSTGVVGKWDCHPSPLDVGFDKFFGFMGGCVDSFGGGSTAKHWRLGREPFTDFGDVPGRFYATDAYIDYSIQFIREWKKKDAPFALYLAPGAPHSPLQAPEPLVRKYRGRFMEGWEANQRKRYQNQLALGVIKSGTKLPEWPNHHRKWEELSELDRSWEDYRRAIYAAMIESIDTNIGRLKAELVQLGEWDNTVFMFCSDNGGDARNLNKAPYGLPWMPGFHVQGGLEWAGVSNTPFRWYKMQQHRGGASTPLIISWPRGLKAKGWSGFHGHLVDIHPTLLDLAGVEYPERLKGSRTIPLVGVSMSPVLQGKAYTRDKPIYFNYATNKGLIDGTMKLVSVRKGPWELYDLDVDPTELNDLSAAYPERVQELIAKWLIEARKDGRSDRSAEVGEATVPWGIRTHRGAGREEGEPNAAEQPPVWESPPALSLQGDVQTGAMRGDSRAKRDKLAEPVSAEEYAVPERRDDGIEVADLRTLDCDPEALIGIVENIADGNLGAIRSFLIAKDGALVLEHYFGDAGIDTLHPLRSITKSVTAYAVGKAIERGEIRSVDDPILEYLPEVNREAVRPGVEKITIKDCLTMQSGLRYENSQRRAKVFTQKNHIPWILEEWTNEVISEGPRFSYSYSDPVIISHLLYNAAGKTIEEYAKEHLFQPMGIEHCKFRQMSCGMTYAVDGLELRSRDTLKLGLLTLNGGVWNGKQILNEAFIKEATTAHTEANASGSYGYFWWVPDVAVHGKPCPTTMAFGAGGQVIYVVPEYQLVVVFTADKVYEHKILRSLLQKEILPAFRPRKRK